MVAEPQTGLQKNAFRRVRQKLNAILRRITARQLATWIPLCIPLLALVFVFKSTSNPLWVSVVFEAIGQGLLVGIAGSVSFLFLERWLRHKPLKPTRREWIVLSWAGGLICVISCLVIYSSNTPTPLRADVTLNYPFRCDNGLPPQSMQFESDAANLGYSSMTWALVRFAKKSDRNREIVRRLASTEFLNQQASRSVLRDLTQHLVLDALNYPISGEGIDAAIYRQEGATWLAIPHASIRGERIPLQAIDGVYASNPFKGIGIAAEAGHPGNGIAAPKGTRVSVRNEGETQSVIELRNSYFTTRIGINVEISSGLHTMKLREDQFRPAWTVAHTEVEEEHVADRSTPYEVARVMVHFDSSFDRLRYGFRAMRHHEEWAKNQFEYLRRVLGWGDISYASVFSLPFEEVKSLRPCAGPSPKPKADAVTAQ